MFGGYKGLGVSLMVEVLAGIVAGGIVSPEVAKQRKEPDQVMNCSQLFIAINPAMGGPAPWGPI